MAGIGFLIKRTGAAGSFPSSELTAAWCLRGSGEAKRALGLKCVSHFFLGETKKLLSIEDIVEYSGTRKTQTGTVQGRQTDAFPSL